MRSEVARDRSTLRSVMLFKGGFVSVLLFLCLQLTVHAQSYCNQLDSLRAVANSGKRDSSVVIAMQYLAFCLSNTSIEEAIALDTVAQKLGFEIGYMRGVINTSNHLSAYYRRLGKFDKAIGYAKTASEEALKAGRKKGAIMGFLELASSYQATADWKKALNCLEITKSLCLEDSVEHKLFLAQTAQLSGITYYEIRDFDAALKADEEALRIFRSIGDLPNVSAMESNIGNVFYAKKEYAKASSIYKKGIDNALSSGYESVLGPRYINYGASLSVQNKYDSARVALETGLAYLKKYKNLHLEAVALGNLSDLYNLTGTYPKALQYGLQALELNRKMGTKDSEMIVNHAIARAYIGLGEARKAEEHYEKFIEMKDSLLGVEAAAEIAELRVQYETAAKEAEIKLLEAQSQALQLDSERKTFWVIIAISIATGLLLLVIMFFIRSRANQKVLENELARKKAEFGQKKADLEQRALRAQMNPHFLFNSLNAIQRLYVQGNIDRAGDFMADFAQLLRKILDHSGVQKVLIAEEIETLRLYLGLEQSRIDGGFEFEITIDEDIDIFNTYMPPLLVQPFAENAIWHGILPLGRPGKIRINFSGLENRADFDLLKCTVEDDGIGIENSINEKSRHSSHKSKGMSLTTERLAPLGSVIAEQKPEGGTKVTIIIPLILND